MSKVMSAAEAAALIPDKGDRGQLVPGLCCPDAVLEAIGQRFEAEGAPHLTSVHPIAAGDMFGTKGMDPLRQARAAGSG